MTELAWWCTAPALPPRPGTGGPTRAAAGRGSPAARPGSGFSHGLPQHGPTLPRRPMSAGAAARHSLPHAHAATPTPQPSWVCPITNRRRARDGGRDAPTHPRDVVAAEAAARNDILARQRLERELLARHKRDAREAAAAAEAMAAVTDEVLTARASTVGSVGRSYASLHSAVAGAMTPVPPADGVAGRTIAWRPASAGTVRGVARPPCTPQRGRVVRPQSAGVSRVPGPGALADAAAAAPLPILHRQAQGPHTHPPQAAAEDAPDDAVVPSAPQPQAQPPPSSVFARADTHTGPAGHPGRQRPMSGKVRGTGASGAYPRTCADEVGVEDTHTAAPAADNGRPPLKQRPQSCQIGRRGSAGGGNGGKERQGSEDLDAGALLVSEKQWNRAVRALTREMRAVRGMIEVERESLLKLLASNMHYGRAAVERAVNAKRLAKLNKLLKHADARGAALAIEAWYLRCGRGGTGRRALVVDLRGTWKVAAEVKVTEAHCVVAKQYDNLARAMRDDLECGWELERGVVVAAEAEGRGAFEGDEAAQRENIVMLLHMNDDEIVFTAKVNRVLDAEGVARSHIHDAECDERDLLVARKADDMLLVAPGHRAAALRIEAFFFAVMQGMSGRTERCRALRHDLRCLRERAGMTQARALLQYVKRSQVELYTAIAELEDAKARGAGRAPHDSPRRASNARAPGLVDQARVEPHMRYRISDVHDAAVNERRLSEFDDDSRANMLLLRELDARRKSRDARQHEWQGMSDGRLAVLAQAYERGHRNAEARLEENRSTKQATRFKDLRKELLRAQAAGRAALADEEATAFVHHVEMFSRHTSVILTAQSVVSPVVAAPLSPRPGPSFAASSPLESCASAVGSPESCPADASADLAVGLAKLVRREAAARGLIFQQGLDTFVEQKFVHDEACFTIVWRGTRACERDESAARDRTAAEEDTAWVDVSACARRACDVLARRERFRRAVPVWNRMRTQVHVGTPPTASTCTPRETYAAVLTPGEALAPAAQPQPQPQGAKGQEAADADAAATPVELAARRRSEMEPLELAPVAHEGGAMGV